MLTDGRSLVLVTAIDPGVTGAVAFVNPVDRRVQVIDLPLTLVGKRRTVDPYALADILSAHQISNVVIENIVAIGTMKGRKRGIKTTGDFLYGAGVLFGVCGSQDLPTSFVYPAKWKRDLGLIGKTKDASRLLAIKLFPGAAHLLKRKKDKDRAEAILIAHHYIITHAGYGVSERPRLRVVPSSARASNMPSLHPTIAAQRSSALGRPRSGSHTSH